MKTVLYLMLLVATAPFVAAQPTPGVPLSEDFDGVTPPALPYGWVATNAQGPDPLWLTDASSSDTAPNAAYIDDPLFTVSDKRLDSPAVHVLTAAAHLVFRQHYSFWFDFIDGSFIPYDGGVLEISIAGGPFVDILDAGGSFTHGGYDYIVGTGTNPLAGRHAWMTQTVGYIDTNVILPMAAAGRDVAFRWRMGSGLVNGGEGGSGWWIDSVRLCDGFDCKGYPTPARLDVDAAGNGVLEQGETVVVSPFYYNYTHLDLTLTGGIGDVAGPPGSSFQIADGWADYGTIGQGGGLGGCVYTGDCYSLEVDDGGTRPAQHWDEQLWEDLSNGEVNVWALHVGGSFADLTASKPFYSFVETIFHRGVTGGCAGTDYCPDDPALRKQMAVFLLKAKLGAAYVPPPAAGIFTDVPATDAFAPWVENLYNLGITGGCATSPLRYCPDETVLRRQMSVFLLKALNGSGYAPPACQGIFSDVPCPGPFADWVEDLFVRQIAAGCGNGSFCPDNPNTRGQMAVFLAKTFGLTLYGP